MYGNHLPSRRLLETPANGYLVEVAARRLPTAATLASQVLQRAKGSDQGLKALLDATGPAWGTERFPRTGWA